MFYLIIMVVLIATKGQRDLSYINYQTYTTTFDMTCFKTFLWDPTPPIPHPLTQLQGIGKSPTCPVSMPAMPSPYPLVRCKLSSVKSALCGFWVSFGRNRVAQPTYPSGGNHDENLQLQRDPKDEKPHQLMEAHSLFFKGKGSSSKTQTFLKRIHESIPFWTSD